MTHATPTPPKVGRPTGWRKQNARVSLGNWRVKRETRDKLRELGPQAGGIGKLLDWLVENLAD